MRDTFLMTLQQKFKSLKSYQRLKISKIYNVAPPEPLDQNCIPLTPLVLKDLHHVQIVGTGDPGIIAATHGNVLLVQNCTDIVIDGLTFTGAGNLWHANAYYFALILLAGVNERITIRNCHFASSGNHGVAHLWGPRTSNNCTVENCVFEDGGNYNRDGLGGDGAAIAIGGYGTKISNNRINGWLRGIEVEGHDIPVDASKVLIQGNTIENVAWHSIMVTPTGGQVESFNQITIANNIIRGTPKKVEPFSNCGIYVTGGRNIQITGNQIRETVDGIGILAITDHGQLSGCMIANNNIESPGRTGIHVGIGASKAPVVDCMVQGNYVHKAGGVGINVKDADAYLLGNLVSDCAYTGYLGDASLNGGNQNIDRNNGPIP